MTPDDAPPLLPPLPELSEPAGRGPLAPFRRTRRPLKWICGALLVVDVIALLFVMSFANVTAEGAAQRGLAQSAAILTEVDTYLDDNYESIRTQAIESDSAGESIELPDYPIAVSITPQEVREGDRESFRALLLERSGAALYDGGVAVMREGRASEDTFFSTQGAIRTGMDFLRPTPHRVLTYVTIGIAAAAAVLAAGLVLTSGGYGRPVGLGFSVLLGSSSFLIFAVAVRFALRVAADGVDDYVAREFLELGQELTWAPIRNALIFAIGSGALFFSGALLARWDDLGLGSARH